MKRDILALAVVLTPAIAAAQTDHRTLSSPAAIYNLAGTIKVVAGTGRDIAVDVARGGADASQLTVATGVIHDRETLRVVYPGDRIVYSGIPEHTTTDEEVDDDGTWGGNWHLRGRRVRIVSSGSGLDAHADLTVRLPAGGRLAVYLAAGEATLTNVDGDIVADLSAASLVAEHVKGALKVDAGSGAVRLTDITGDLAMDCGSGAVMLTGVSGQRLDIDAGSGDVRGSRVAYKRAKLDLGSGGMLLTGFAADEVALDAGSGNVDIALVGPVRRVAIDAGSGDVTLRLPSAFAASVEIDAGSGGVKSDFALSQRGDDDSHYTGRIGTGGGELTIDGGSGTIALMKQP